MDKIKEAADYIRSIIGDRIIDMAVVLGSGLNDLADIVENAIEIDYKDIPNFPVSTVVGHAGKLIIGNIGDTNVLLMKNRVNYYEGYGVKEVVFPVRVMHLLGIKKLMLTNAAGAVNTSYAPGDIAIITDHMNLGMQNPMNMPPQYKNNFPSQGIPQYPQHMQYFPYNNSFYNYHSQANFANFSPSNTLTPHHQINYNSQGNLGDYYQNQQQFPYKNSQSEKNVFKGRINYQEQGGEECS